MRNNVQLGTFPFAPFCAIGDTFDLYFLLLFIIFATPRKRLAMHTATVTSKALTVDSKTSETRVRLEQPTIFLKFCGCDTQGVKK